MKPDLHTRLRDFWMTESGSFTTEELAEQFSASRASVRRVMNALYAEAEKLRNESKDGYGDGHPLARLYMSESDTGPGQGGISTGRAPKIYTWMTM